MLIDLNTITDRDILVLSHDPKSYKRTKKAMANMRRWKRLGYHVKLENGKPVGVECSRCGKRYQADQLFWQANHAQTCATDLN